MPSSEQKNIAQQHSALLPKRRIRTTQHAAININAVFSNSSLSTASEGRHAVLSSSRMLEHYQIIGQTLQTCEAASFRAGTPWLLPTKRVKLLRQGFEKSLHEFIRLNLVAVNSATLECYCEDLETLPTDRKSVELLSLGRPTRAERYSGAAILLALSFLAGFSSALYVAGDPFVALTAACIASWIALFASIVASSESYRRTSFYWLLSKELMRRRGITGNGTEIPILPVEPVS